MIHAIFQHFFNHLLIGIFIHFHFKQLTAISDYLLVEQVPVLDVLIKEKAIILLKIHTKSVKERAAAT